MANNTLVPSVPRKLVRPVGRDRMVAGVCAGIAHYVNVDPTVVRIAFALLTVFTGVVPGIIVYLVLMLVIPQENE